MSLYSKYEQLLERPYTEGEADCYGLLRDYYRVNYGLQLTNYARPVDFAHSGVNLIGENLLAEGFVVCQTSLDRLQVGDGLLISIGTSLPNHVAVFVGNGYILHHLYKLRSSADPLEDRWRQRTLNVVRHPLVTQQNAQNYEQVDLLSLIPPHVKARHGIFTS